jgi:hypothetical protein
VSPNFVVIFLSTSFGLPSVCSLELSKAARALEGRSSIAFDARPATGVDRDALTKSCSDWGPLGVAVACFGKFTFFVDYLGPSALSYCSEDHGCELVDYIGPSFYFGKDIYLSLSSAGDCSEAPDSLGTGRLVSSCCAACSTSSSSS